MIKIKASVEVSNATKAKIVRAFYDAAERHIQEQQGTSNFTDAVAEATLDLDALLAQAKTLTSQEFAQRLQKAADAFFERASAQNTDQVRGQTEN